MNINNCKLSNIHCCSILPVAISGVSTLTDEKTGIYYLPSPKIIYTVGYSIKQFTTTVLLLVFIRLTLVGYIMNLKHYVRCSQLYNFLTDLGGVLVLPTNDSGTSTAISR